jgi:membrane-associated protein
MDFVNHVIVAFASSPWAYAVVFLLVTIDGICALVPGEAVLVGLGAIAISTGSPNPFLLVLVAACAAFIGDNVAFRIGRGISAGPHRFKPTPRIARAAEAARVRLERSPATYILGARFIPLGRVVTNYVAGATSLSQRIFLRCTAVSAMCWSLYTVLIGSFIGAWLPHAPLLAAGLGVVLAVLVGITGDVIARRRRDAVAQQRVAGRLSELHGPTADEIHTDEQLGHGYEHRVPLGIAPATRVRAQDSGVRSG